MLFTAKKNSLSQLQQSVTAVAASC